DGGGGGNFLRTALRDWRADIIHFHWLHPYLIRDSLAGTVSRSLRFLAEVATLKSRGSTIGWTIHNLVNHNNTHPHCEQAFSTAFAKFTDACFVHSAAAADAAAARFSIPKNKLHVIPHPNYIGTYPNTISQPESRSKLDLPSGAPIFLFLGRIEPYKGVEDLVDVFSRCSGDAHLVIAGKVTSPPLHQDLEAAASKNPNIHLVPERIEDDQLQVFFNAADFVIFPFRQILTSGSALLAMSFAKAIIAPKLPSLQEIIPPGGAIWFSPQQRHSLASAIRDAPALIDPITAGQANLDRVRPWTWASTALQMTSPLSKTNLGYQ
ncbi:MAG: glycosyltransferase family 4 protein, partial [Verrucomicrobiales bacterium]|nr:glycosyltransferase family 4 protein [Verrucomicrobiales bacterium]